MNIVQGDSLDKSKRFFLAKSREKFIKGIEDSKKPFLYVAAFFLVVIILRILFEVAERKIAFTIELFFHFAAFYVSVALTTIIIFTLFTKRSPIKTSRVILPFFSIIILPIIIDFLVTIGKGAQICYFQISDATNALQNFVTIGGPFRECGVTLGIRIEMILMLILFAYYIYLKIRKVLPTITATVLLYTSIFAYGNFPFIINSIISPFGGVFESSMRSQLLIAAYLFLIFIQGAALFFISKKELFIAIIRELRSFRLVHFIIMLIFGAGIAIKMGKSLAFANLFALVLSVASIVCAFIFLTIQNNIADVLIDKYSNNKRPLQSIKITPKEYHTASLIFLFFSAAFSLVSGILSFAFLAALIIIYYTYSVPPLRLKRVPIFSKLLIALSTLLCIILGYALTSESLNPFPAPILALILIGFTLAINFIDIKDYAGDKNAGIKTLPVLFGLKKAKILIGIFFIFAYALAYFVLNKPFLLPLIIAFAFLEFFLINRKIYDERSVFAVYIFSFILLSAFYLM